MGSALPITKPNPLIAIVIDRYFQVSLFLLITTGFITLISTGRLDPLSVLFVAIALVLRGYFLLKRVEFSIPEKWTTYLTLVYVLVFAVDLFAISGSYVTASVHMVLFSMVVKLFSIRNERDYVYLAILAFLAVLAASLLTVDTLFLASFCIFILLAVNTFVSMEIRRSFHKAVHLGSAPADPRTERRFASSLSLAGLLIVVSILLISTGMFFLLPRFSAGYFSGYAPRNDLVSGFSDQVNLGAIGRIQQNDSVVMHVKMESDPAPDLKFRGVALNVFDGKTWSNETRGQDVLPSVSGHFVLRGEQIRKRNLPGTVQDPRHFRFLRYRVILEPIGTNVLFLAPVPVELDGRFREISVDETGSVTNTDRNRLSESYEAVSQISEIPRDALRNASGKLPPEITLMYLDHHAVDERVQELAAQITANSKSNYDKAAAIEHYLRANFSYTLQLPSKTPEDPVAHFLFERKRGHCEYFASAMAVMLRSVGIPSRMISGFRNGQLNDLTGSYVVRALDAHAWVEAYLPGIGWTSFDPTPAAIISEQTTWSRVQMYLDAAQSFWREWVINYDFNHQRELTISTATKAQHKAYDVRRWFRHEYRVLLNIARKFNARVSSDPKSWLALGTLIVLIALLLWNMRGIIRGLRQRAIARRPSRSPQRAATIWYSKMLKSVERRGYPKPPAQTPAEFVLTIPEASLRESVSKFTERYERARFGDSRQDAEELPGLYEEIVSKK